MSNIGEKLMGSMCYNGWGRRTETGHDEPTETETLKDTSTTESISMDSGERNGRKIPRKMSNEMVKQPAQETDTNKNSTSSSSEPKQEMNHNITDNGNHVEPKCDMPKKENGKIQHANRKNNPGRNGSAAERMLQRKRLSKKGSVKRTQPRT